MSAMFSPSVSRPFTCTDKTTPRTPQVSQPKQLLQESAGICLQLLHPCEGVRAATHHVVVNGEVVVELDDALGLHLELPVGLLRPPLLDVAVAVVLASCGPRHMTSERGDVGRHPAHHLLHLSALQLNPEPTLAGRCRTPSQAGCSPSQQNVSNKSDGWLSAKGTWACATPKQSHSK